MAFYQKALECDRILSRTDIREMYIFLRTDRLDTDLKIFTDIQRFNHAKGVEIPVTKKDIEGEMRRFLEVEEDKEGNVATRLKMMEAGIKGGTDS